MTIWAAILWVLLISHWQAICKNIFCEIHKVIQITHITLVCDALSDPAKSIMKSFPVRMDWRVVLTRLRSWIVTCRTACDLDDVLLAAVGSWVRSLLPCIRRVITCYNKQRYRFISSFSFSVICSNSPTTHNRHLFARMTLLESVASWHTATSTNLHNVIQKM